VRDVLELRAGDAAVVVDPAGGGRITRLAVGGADLLTPAGCFVMAPWAGRTGWGRFTHDGAERRVAVDAPPHAIHGTVRGVGWSVLDAGPDHGLLEAPLGPGWPWPGRCRHELRLGRDRLLLRAEVHADADPFPATLGWHPWFAKPAAVELGAAAMLERDDDHLPTGRRVAAVAPGQRPLDDCFEDVRWPVELRGVAGVDVRVDAEGCRFAVVYDEQAGATCVEPQTGPPDALRLGEAAPVAPGRPLVASMAIRWGP